jgi:hypothetical protein
VMAFFDGLDLVDPGLVHVPLWRPDQGQDTRDDKPVAAYGGVGYKR